MGRSGNATVLKAVARIKLYEILFAEELDIGFPHVTGLINKVGQECAADAFFLEFRQYGQRKNDDVLAVRVMPDELFELFVGNVVLV